MEWVNTCTDWDDWDKPSPPFRIFGNSYYMGTCGITAILITSNDGHILIDGGIEAGADVIVENIEDLGFSLNDVKLLLHSHEHFDHVAGLAKLQKLSGAKLLASREAAPVLRTGMTADIDPQAGIHKPFPASRVDGMVKDGEIVNLGSLALTPMDKIRERVKNGRADNLMFFTNLFAHIITDKIQLLSFKRSNSPTHVRVLC